MLSLSPKQLCDFYLDGNSEAAFEVFEHGGPDGLRSFLGIQSEKIWGQVYSVILGEHGFLLRLCRKYPHVTLDELFRAYMQDVFHGRQRNQIGTFFAGLREKLRRDLGI